MIRLGAQCRKSLLGNLLYSVLICLCFLLIRVTVVVPVLCMCLDVLVGRVRLCVSVLCVVRRSLTSNWLC